MIGLFHRSGVVIVIVFSTGLLLCAIPHPAMAQESSKSPAPTPGTPLTWKRVVHLHDGRTFVSDGAIALDAELAKARGPSSEALPEVNAKIVEGYLTAELPDEFAFSQLGRRSDVYASPSGVTLNPIYIDYLRRTLPESRLRLRMKGNLEPVVILLDGKAVGLLMAMKSVNP